MSTLLHHLLLALAVLALGQAALRIAARAGATGLARFVAAVVIGVGIAVTQALALGLVGLGANPLALSLAAAVTWAGVTALLPGASPAGSAGAELAAWWRGLDRVGRLATAAGGGACAAWLVWQLSEPSIGFDSSLYHYPFVAGWIENGSPGSGLELSYDIPYNSYPLTDEVALTWGAGIARSWVPLSLWNPFTLAMLAAGIWLTLRNLSVARLPAGLAVGVLATQPLIV
ncbi:MAG TPA: hypothetical protein VEQ61_11175, partial [Thermoleophilaceae bacterium]|nr:hypothetical protein [Thermoleophilaceae bacterium]